MRILSQALPARYLIDFSCAQIIPTSVEIGKGIIQLYLVLTGSEVIYEHFNFSFVKSYLDKLYLIGIIPNNVCYSNDVWFYSMQKPRQKRQERTRQAILDAARQILADEGPQGFSMRTLADRIDYSPAGLYEYFENKEDIIRALSTQGHQMLRDHLLLVYQDLPPAEYLTALGLAYIEFALSNPDYYMLMFTHSPTPAQVERMFSESSSYPVLLHAIQKGVEAGVFNPRQGFGIQEMAYAAWAMVHGIAMLRITYLKGSPIPFETVDRETLKAFSRGL